jgi:hypothetical protein
MRKAKMVLEQPVMWVLIIIIGLIIAYGIYHLISALREKGLSLIFG